MGVPNSAVPPRLLVSVRNVTECAAAMAGGADWIDVKEPSRGSLGWADASVVTEIVRLMRSHPQIPLSIALGELQESAALPWQEAAIPTEVTYVKVGLAGYGSSNRWQSDWFQLKQRIEQSAGRSLGWIAVAYADAGAAGAPAWRSVLDFAIQQQCAGLLVDTFRKQNGGLKAVLSGDDLHELAVATASAGIGLALAGQIHIDDLASVQALGPAVIAVRSAACSGGDRVATIDMERVEALKRAIAETAQAKPEMTVRSLIAEGLQVDAVG